MNLYSSYSSRLLKLVFVLLAALILTGCSPRPRIHYIDWNPANDTNYNVWEKMGSSYWFRTPYESVAIAEYERVTGHDCDTIPLTRYGFSIWTDGNIYHVTQ